MAGQEDIKNICFILRWMKFETLYRTVYKFVGLYCINCIKSYLLYNQYIDLPIQTWIQSYWSSCLLLYVEYETNSISKKSIGRFFIQFKYYRRYNYWHKYIEKVLYAFFIAVWAQIFCEFWKRHQKILTDLWNLHEESGDGIRIDYEKRAKEC